MSCRNEVRDLISQGKTEKALNLMRRHHLEERWDEDEIVLVLSRFNRTESDMRKGVISQTERNREVNCINAAILDILKKTNAPSKINPHIPLNSVQGVSQKDTFQERSLKIIKKLIDEKRLGMLTECIRVFTEKEYYSKLTGIPIKFDFSIELWPLGSNKCSILYVINCKDHPNRVSIDKLETFHSQITQLGFSPTKGIFIANSPLNEDSYMLADSLNILVVQGESSENFKIILHKKNKVVNTEKRIPISTNTKNIDLIDKGVRLIEKIVDEQILQAFCTVSDSYISYKIDKLSKKDIEEIANKELEKINTRRGTDKRALNVKLLKDFLLTNYQINIKTIYNQKAICGSCNIQEKVIELNGAKVVNTRRELFILAHEFGHFILHQKLSIGQNMLDSFKDYDFSFKNNRYELSNPKQWTEWQANYFASSLIFPKVLFLKRLYSTRANLGMSNKTFIYLDDQPQNIKDFNTLVSKLAYIFNTTNSSIIYRMKDLGILKLDSRIKSIGQLISKYCGGL